MKKLAVTLCPQEYRQARQAFCNFQCWTMTAQRVASALMAKLTILYKRVRARKAVRSVVIEC